MQLSMLACIIRNYSFVMISLSAGVPLYSALVCLFGQHQPSTRSQQYRHRIQFAVFTSLQNSRSLCHSHIRTAISINDIRGECSVRTNAACKLHYADDFISLNSVFRNQITLLQFSIKFIWYAGSLLLLSRLNEYFKYILVAGGGQRMEEWVRERHEND